MDKRELEGIYSLDRNIESKMRQIEELKETIYGIKGLDYSDDKIITSNVNTQDALIVKYMDQKKEMEEEIEELLLKKKRARRLIAKLDTRESLILNLRYMEGLDWEGVAKFADYSRIQVIRIHNQALKNLKNIIDDECENIHQ